MKANELMIGDFVFHETYGNAVIETIDNDFTDNPSVKIISENIKHKDGYKYGYCWCDLDEIFPIPLTSEILEKNGFAKSVSPPGIHVRCYELDNPEERYVLTIADYNKYKRLLLNIDSEDSECFNIKCVYIHQLQHALKLCGIEKEIEL